MVTILSDPMMKILSEVVTAPSFKPWEVRDTMFTLPCDLARAEASPTSVVLEGLHQVAYRSVAKDLFEGERERERERGGTIPIHTFLPTVATIVFFHRNSLSNSLYCPQRNLSKFSSQDVS